MTDPRPPHPMSAMFADDHWKRETCGNCELRVCNDRDPRVPVGFGQCRGVPQHMTVVKVDPVMGPTMGMGYDCVEEGSFACSRWVPKVWVRPPVLVAASHVPSFVDMRRKQ